MVSYRSAIRAAFSEDGIYRHVPDAIRWIKEHNPMAAFELYMKDPRLFMQAIGEKYATANDKDGSNF